MKYIILFLLLAAGRCSFGQTDTNAIAVGDWSSLVSDDTHYALRGRLLIYDSEGTNKWGYWTEPRVYVELQHICRDFSGFPIEFEVDDMKCLHFEMHDAFGRPIRSDIARVSRTLPSPFTVSLPCDSTLRLRVDRQLGSKSKPDGFQIDVNGGFWDIRTGATNSYFLSAIFIPSTNIVVAPNSHLWGATLELPKVQIPVKKL